MRKTNPPFAPGPPLPPGRSRRREIRPDRQPRDADESGAIAVLFALALPVIVLFLGGALDYSRALEARTRLQTATESTLSNLHSRIRSGMVRDRRQLASLFLRHMRAEHEKRLRKKGLKLEKAHISLARSRMNVTVQAKVRAPFLGLVGQGWIPVTAVAGVRITPSPSTRRMQWVCRRLLSRFRRAHDLERHLRRMRAKGAVPERIHRMEELYDGCLAEG